jgi:hypothetical protein
MTYAARQLRRCGMAILLGLFMATPLLAHEIGGRDAAFVAATQGPEPGAFLYLGAKHMVTGVDHLLFLLGVIFFLWRFRDILIYVSLFSLGHSLTLLAGVLFGFGFNAYLVDAAIGLSVVYKAFDNLHGFEMLGLPRPNPRAAVLAFGLVHGMGLATKLLTLGLNANGLVANLVSFNIGVELGQATALSLIIVPLLLWRRHASFQRFAITANWLMMVAGFSLIGLHLAGYFLIAGAST